MIVMESNRKLFGFLLLLWITSDAAVDSFPDSFSKNELTSSKNLVGVSTQIIANALIQGQAESSSNYISSPIGYATILSILSQGSSGSTRKEILDVLELPEQHQDVCNAFRTVLSDYAGNDSMIAPQFKTWFYIYKNNNVNEEFKKHLTRDFLVDVKDIERLTFGFDSTRSDPFFSDEKTTNSKDILQFDDLRDSKDDEEVQNDAKFDDLKTEDGNNEESVKLAISDYDQIDKEEKSKVSKFDSSVDDRQYVEKSVIDEELKQKEETQVSDEENESGPEKISLPIKKIDDDSMEIMEAQEKRNFVSRFGRAQPLHQLGDVTSALSGNSIMGRKDDDPNAQESQMLLFNGLYFHGEWANKFRKTEETKTFNSLKRTQDVKFITSNGLFKYAEIPSQNLVAVELPYKNDRYSLLIVMPQSQTDMKQFSKQSNYNNLNEVITQLEMANLRLYVPIFRFECTSRAEKALQKLGLTTLFTSKADLSGISPDPKGYQIEELVQHVAIRIDEALSTENALSASNVQARQSTKYLELSIDKPFLFYVRDTLNDVILTTGKIMEIPEEEIAVTFNI